MSRLIKLRTSLVKFAKTRLKLIKPDDSQSLLRQLVRYFLWEAIEDRAEVLATAGNDSATKFIPLVSDENLKRLEKAINEELHRQSQATPPLDLLYLESKLNGIFLPQALTDDDFTSRANFANALRKARAEFTVRSLFHPSPLSFWQSGAVAGILLRAVQQTILEIIPTEYPAMSGAGKVPESTKSMAKKLLARVDSVSRQLLPLPAPKTSSTAEAELRVAIARSEGRACLPLRSIPTAPLVEEDLEKHYVGRPDEDACRLARQLRHADGTILVTGYRGVGKSSFVNRVIYHALQAQKDVPPEDGWLLVPVTVNLAKVSGVQNILRLTLRAVRNALLNIDDAKTRPIPGFTQPSVLPLNLEKEITPLQDAYMRATFKVSMTRSNTAEKKWEAGSSVSFDPGKVIAPFAGLELGKFFSFGFSRSRAQKLNRELSLLDYDENAAEEDLAQLIRSLATPRPLFGERGPKVRIKLIFIFDELDKMKLEEGLNPMIEGLKNLFLQQYAVFILVTSKNFYYYLLKARAVEDAMLNSYFSAIVHVPLLTFAQARKMVEDWVEWPQIGPSKEPSPIEVKLLDQLTRVLLYRSFGNPRDIIRELRQMQEWAGATERPYLTDQLGKSQVFQIFCGVQECIEKAAVPQSAALTTAPGSDAGGLMLVAERLVGDESRLEQVRRGLYILTEEIINRQTLSLEASALEQLQKDNFSLLSVSDVEQLARRLGLLLGAVHKTLPPEVFTALNVTTPLPLFQNIESPIALRATYEFYRLTGRQASISEVESAPVQSQVRSVEELKQEAEKFAARSGWAEQLSAIGMIKQLGPSQLTPALEKFLLKVSTEDSDISHRRLAAERLSSEMLFKVGVADLVKLVTSESDENMLATYLRLLGGASDGTSRKFATECILALLKQETGTPGVDATRRLSGNNAVDALTVLLTVADREVVTDTDRELVREVLDWLCSSKQSDVVQETALRTLNSLAERFGVDQAQTIISNLKFLTYFAAAESNDPLTMWIRPGLRPQFATHLRTLISVEPLQYAQQLLAADVRAEVNPLLTYIWQNTFNPVDPKMGRLVLTFMSQGGKTVEVSIRLLPSLRQTPEFSSRILPYLLKSYEQLQADSRFSPEETERVFRYLGELQAPQIVTPGPLAGIADGLPETLRMPGSVLSRWRSDVEARRTYGNPLDLRRLTYSMGALGTVVAGAVFYKRDLPTGGLWWSILSRLLLFVADFGVAFPALLSFDSVKGITRKGDWPRFQSNTKLDYPQKKAFSSAFDLFPFWTAIALLTIHTKYIAPLSFWNQVLQFLINLPAVVLIYLALRTPDERY